MSLNSLSAQQNRGPEFLIQYSNQTSIKKLAFNHDGSLLASADNSGLLILRDVSTRINFAAKNLKNSEINFIRFEDNDLFVCGDYGLEIYSIWGTRVILKQSVPIRYLYHYTQENGNFYFVGNDGKIFRVSSFQLMDPINKVSFDDFDLLMDFEEPMHHVSARQGSLCVTGPYKSYRFDLVESMEEDFNSFENTPSPNAKVIELRFNLSMYSTVEIDSLGLIIPAYEHWLSFIDPLTGNTSSFLPGYRLVKIDSMEGFEVGEMGVKAATLVDQKSKIIYLPEQFSASAINKEGIIALGDYYGNVFLYEPVNQVLIEKIPSSTSVNQIATISEDGKLLALSSGNTRKGGVKVIHLSSGKILYEHQDERPDLSKMAFGKENASLYLFYPDQQVDEIVLTENNIHRKTIAAGVDFPDNRSLGIINFSIGNGSANSLIKESEFLAQTAQPGLYTSSGEGYSIQLERPAEIDLSKRPSYQEVNFLLEKFELDQEEALFDQLEKDLFVGKAYRYSEENFLNAAKRLNISTEKAKKLYDFIRSPGKNKITLLRPGMNEVSFSLLERPRSIYVSLEHEQLYIIGDTLLYIHSFSSPEKPTLLLFRQNESLSNYFFDLKHQRLVFLNGNQVKLFNLHSGLEQFRLYAFEESVLFQTPEGYYYSSGRIPPMAFVHHGRLMNYRQLDIQYNRPDLVLSKMGSPDSAMIQSYRKAYQKRMHKLGIDPAIFQTTLSIPEADFVGRGEIKKD
ncbi:MAG: hypothetical protein LPK45_04245, partial [Bacteroidota bacterium]|nr:hypothetical protein [Bacteroidota bacterium]MDX5430264.1 hypothetical protein [Bacteroidota bacterium]MDX5469025.1 hypothetical protein [Bacteroidota bacterium]